MRVLHYDCFAGISGDMNLAAMLDLGVPLEYLQEELSKLNLDEYGIKVCKADKNGIFGTQVKVIDRNAHPGHHHDHGHTHGSHRYLGNHNHHHEHEAAPVNHHHEHRSFLDIKELIEGSTLGEKVRKCALNIFHTLAEAEAQVHNRPVIDVHFHEVGAIDSIVDIIGAAICLDYLRIDQVTCSEVELGSGTVRCAHGVMPVPAPATAILAKNFPSRIGGTEHEATTPTGAAYLSAVVDRFGGSTAGRCIGTGTGIGHRDPDRLPNILRVMLYETETEGSGVLDGEGHSEIAANIDDMTPEHLSWLVDKLFEAGADDVWMEPIYMKKGRPGTKVCALVKTPLFLKVKETFFRHSSSLGLREIPVNKHFLQREIYDKITLHGKVRVKKTFLPDGSSREKLEYEDCRSLAEEQGLPVKEMTDLLSRDE